MRNKDKLTDLMKSILEELGVDMKIGDLQNTPERMARSWLEITKSYLMELPKVKTFKVESVQILGIHRLHYFSLCEHHGLPFEGSVCILYVPDEKLIGLSKPARLVDYYSHFLMIQERFTRQLVEAMKTNIEPLAIYVVVRGRHLCSAMRGVGSREHEFITEEMWFKNDACKDMWEGRLRNSEHLCKEVRQ